MSATAMLSSGSDKATTTSSIAPISLEALLTASDLLSYHDALRNVLKLRHAGDIGDTDRGGCCESTPSTFLWFNDNRIAFKQRKAYEEGDQQLSREGRTDQQHLQHIIPAERITLCKKIGTGEFGHVFQAAWRGATGDGKEAIQVAVKRILPEKMISQHASFLQEAAIMTRMHHPNVIRLFGVVLETKAVMLVSELAPCGSLLECLQCPTWREPFSVTVLSDFALQIAQGMLYLSGQRLIHRDLAARNVLVCTPSKVKISDFGLSRCLGHGEDYYRSEFSATMKLPIAWCAPECINFLRFTTASDVWSYGVCLWEMFSYGKTPWEGFSGSQILHSIDTQRKKLNCPEACPREVYLLMFSCWEWNAHMRPSFEQICDRLPSLVPPLLVTISESSTARSGHLHYARDETIVLLDKNPPGKAGLWSGITKAGKVGLFRPDDTIAYLGAENPSSSSNGDIPADQLLSEKTKTKKKGGNGNENKGGPKKKKPVVISQPQGDLRHTCHVGADGRSFGLLNVNKKDLAKSLPPKISPRSSPPGGKDGQMCKPADGVIILSPLMSTSMMSLPPPPRPPKRANSTKIRTAASELEDVMSRSVCFGQITGHSSAEYLNSTPSSSLSPPALPPKPPRFRAFANFSEHPSPSAPTPSPSDTLTLPQPGHNHCQQPGTINCQQPDTISCQQPDTINCQQPDTISCQQPIRLLKFRILNKIIPLNRRASNAIEESLNRCEETVEKTKKDEERGREQRQHHQMDEEEEEDDSLLIRPSSVCCEFNKETSKCEEESRILQVLTDLQRDLSAFSLSSLEDCSDGRALLDGEQRREKNFTLMEEQERRLKELSLERHGIVTGHPSDVVGMDRTELKRRENEERKKVLKKLLRDGEEGTDEKRTSVVGSFISSASKMFVGGMVDGKQGEEGEQYQHSKGTNGLSTPSRKEPVTNWPPEAQQAYKLLVQCGQTLRGTSMIGGYQSEEKMPSPKNGVAIGQMAETVEQQKKIEYINSLLVGWESGGREERNDQKSDLDSGTVPYGFPLDSESPLSSPMTSPKNERRSPPPVPPKPQIRTKTKP
uniref:non-specific protein-tyrosine kinase n=1 Tax=Globodera rostochiensis TaxID=31243 RepID=A0A914H529_GLORO